MRAHVGVLRRIARAFATSADQHDLLQELMLAEFWRAQPNFAVRARRPLSFSASPTIARSPGGAAKPADACARANIERLAVEEGAGEDPLLARLYAAIRQLEPLDRSLVLLSLEGQSYAEIAALHGLGQTNVGARLTRARKKLTALTEQDDEL